MDLTDRQRFVLELLTDPRMDGTTSTAVGRRVQERFGATMGKLSNSRRYGGGLAGGNVLKSLERRGLVRSYYPGHGYASAWCITAEGRQVLTGA